MNHKGTKNIYKQDFPIFKYLPNLVYLDSTATSLKPKVVIDKLRDYYEKYSANVFRGIYKISEKATLEYEDTREILAEFVNAKKREEIIFTRNTTEAINLVAYSLGRQIVKENDEVVTSIMEHHSNFVPWQVLTAELGGVLKVINISDDGYLDIFDKDSRSQIPNFSKLRKIISKKTKILTLTYISNVLGTINPIKQIISAVKKINPKIITVIDAAQAAPHLKIDVRDLGCDFLAFSAHKMLGPTGVGVLWGRYEFLEEMFPFNFGGEMIKEVYLDKTTFEKPPLKFEAGTPHVAGVISFKEAIGYLKKLGQNAIISHEKKLTHYCIKTMSQAFGKMITILGPRDIKDRAGIVAFTFGKYHPHDIGYILDRMNIAVRVGHHCAMPLHRRLGIEASSRVSFYIYNTRQDIDNLILGLKKVKNILS